MSELPMAAAGRRQSFFSQDGVDQLVSMVLELAAELWTVRQRLYALERVTEGASGSLPERVDAWRPNAEEAAELEAMRQTMIRELFRVLDRAPEAAGAAGSDVAGEPATTAS